MYTGLIAKRYARALAAFAGAGGREEAVYEQVRRLAASCDGYPQVREVLSSPVLGAEVKNEAVHALLDEEMEPVLDRFVRLVIDHHRERFLGFMLHSYVELYKQRHGIVDVTVTTAAEMDERTAGRISAVVGACSREGSRRVVHEKVDPSLIGGFVCRIDDLLVDASLSGQLARLKKALNKPQNRIV